MLATAPTPTHNVVLALPPLKCQRLVKCKSNRKIHTSTPITIRPQCDSRKRALPAHHKPPRPRSRIPRMHTPRKSRTSSTTRRRRPTSSTMRVRARPGAASHASARCRSRQRSARARRTFRRRARARLSDSCAAYRHALACLNSPLNTHPPHPSTDPPDDDEEGDFPAAIGGTSLAALYADGDEDDEDVR